MQNEFFRIAKDAKTPTLDEVLDTLKRLVAIIDADTDESGDNISRSYAKLSVTDRETILITAIGDLQRMKINATAKDVSNSVRLIVQNALLDDLEEKGYIESYIQGDDLMVRSTPKGDEYLRNKKK